MARRPGTPRLLDLSGEGREQRGHVDPGRRRSACRSASSLGVPEPRAARSPSASLLVGKDMGQRAALGLLPPRCLLLPHEAVSPGRSGPQEKDPPLGAQTRSHLLCTSRHVPLLLWGRASPSVNCEDLAKPAGEPLPVLRQVSALATTTAATARLRPGSGEPVAGPTADAESRWLRRAAPWHPAEN